MNKNEAYNEKICESESETNWKNLLELFKTFQCNEDFLSPAERK